MASTSIVVGIAPPPPAAPPPPCAAPLAPALAVPLAPAPDAPELPALVTPPAPALVIPPAPAPSDPPEPAALAPPPPPCPPPGVSAFPQPSNEVNATSTAAHRTRRDTVSNTFGTARNISRDSSAHKTLTAGRAGAFVYQFCAARIASSVEDR